MKYNLSQIMQSAWKIFRKMGTTFSEALHRAWQSAKARPENERRITKAAADAGIIEEYHTWSDWKKAGYEVIHGSKAVFQAVLIYASKGDGAEYKASFFTASQVAPLTE